MTETNEKYEKILFKYHSNVLDELTVETMWAEIIDKDNGIYKLDNIPFYGPQIATDDEFYAEFDESEKMLTYKMTTKHSGNSIILVVITEKGFDKEIIRNRLKELDCKSEGLSDSYFSMEILKDVNYSQIQKILAEYENDGILEYAEPCLSEKHKTDLKNN
ncbi:DUF4265 domain-containing protein [Algoriphagus machipongonensis]|uniref:DUF4265 domain-containing protein n=1 Tax=Algoriphagus machipongonensis TaxID=388413 RepID=A3I0D9_9BACT|nr:DUF4265 domain-containing protein [Algoriphagus machipongonensis]EAZ79935.1 hypothetical protein ALPR1_14939 [Algoriphagus machipongonensis]